MTIHRPKKTAMDTLTVVLITFLAGILTALTLRRPPALSAPRTPAPTDSNSSFTGRP